MKTITTIICGLFLVLGLTGCPPSPTLSCQLVWQDGNESVVPFEAVDAFDGALAEFTGDRYGSATLQYKLLDWPEVINQQCQRDTSGKADAGIGEPKIADEIILDHLLIGALIALNGYVCPTAVTGSDSFRIYVPMGPSVETAKLEVTSASGQQFVLLFRGPAYGGVDNGPYSLTTQVQGSGTVSPPSGSYASGSTVVATATPASGWSFDHWMVNGAMGSNNAQAQVAMNSDVVLTAVFTQNGTPPPVSVAGVEFTRSGNTGTMRINPGAASLRSITANDSAQYLPANASFADVSGIGLEIVNIPSPYWYIREVSPGTMTANSWSTSIALDGDGTDSAGYAKTLALANWTGGRAIPFYTLSSVPGRIFSLNTGANSGVLNGNALGVDVVGYIWP